MGMTIDEKFKILQDEYAHLMGEYQIMQAEYKARSKAEMVAVLEELKEQLRKMHEDYFETEHFDEAYGLSDSIAIIQQKIDALKGRDNHENNN